MDTKNSGFTSKLVHAGSVPDPLGSAVTPIYQTSTFSFRDAEHGARCFSGEEKGYIYTRIGNPNLEELEVAVAELENGFGGIAASSGMAAVNIVYLTMLGQGDHMISHNYCLWNPSRGIMEKPISKTWR